MDKVHILGHDFAICYVPDSEIEDCQGTMEIGPMVIKIANTATESLQASTLLHEIIEAINSVARMNMPHRTIEVMEVALFQVLRDNPEIAKIISGIEK